MAEFVCPIGPAIASLPRLECLLVTGLYPRATRNKTDEVAYSGNQLLLAFHGVCNEEYDEENEGIVKSEDPRPILSTMPQVEKPHGKWVKFNPANNHVVFRKVKTIDLESLEHLDIEPLVLSFPKFRSIKIHPSFAYHQLDAPRVVETFAR